MFSKKEMAVIYIGYREDDRQNVYYLHKNLTHCRHVVKLSGSPTHTECEKHTHTYSFACWQKVWANRIGYVSFSLVVSFVFSISHFVYSYYHHCGVFIFQFQTERQKKNLSLTFIIHFFLLSFCVFSYHLPFFVALHCFVMYYFMFYKKKSYCCCLCCCYYFIFFFVAVILVSYLYFAIQ